MTEKIYYTPKIEEFHVGFEFEYLGRNTMVSFDWIPAVFDLKEAGEFDDGFMIGWYINEGKCRVKHLDQEDIVECEWKFDEKNNRFEYVWIRKIDHIPPPFPVPVVLKMWKQHNMWKITKEALMFSNAEIVFFGEIKNKSKLLDVMKMIIPKQEQNE